MQSHIQKWGNSLGVRIPAGIAKQLHLHSGSPVALKIENNQIIIQVAKYDLDTMVNAINSKNKHHLQFDNKQIGNEEW